MMINNQDPQPLKSNQDQNTTLPVDDDSQADSPLSKTNTRMGLGMITFGFLMFLLGARPSIFNLDRSPVVGFVQISVFLLGLGVITLGGYMVLNSFWGYGKKTIAADIGTRLISTGYVISVFTGMADIFGLGSHRLPDVFFGPLQARGVSMGMATIAVGFLLLIRYKRPENKKENLKEYSSKNNQTKQQPSSKAEGLDQVSKA